MIRLEKVNENNYNDVISLELAEEQKEFVATNMKSLAQAWVYYEKARPYAVLRDDTVIGFIMFDYNIKARKAEVWRFMIDKRYQGRGYGKAALLAAIEFLTDKGLFDRIQINYVDGNEGAKHLYSKLGFKETGEMEDDEKVMMMPLGN